MTDEPRAPGLGARIRRPTYAYRKVLERLEKHPDRWSVASASHPRGCSFLHDSCVLRFANSDLALSVQTLPEICFGAFCETALMGPQGLIYVPDLGYSDVNRFREPEELEAHLLQTSDAVRGKYASDFHTSARSSS